MKNRKSWNFIHVVVLILSLANIAPTYGMHYLPKIIELLKVIKNSPQAQQAAQQALLLFAGYIGEKKNK